jgi:hypothetical protein
VLQAEGGDARGLGPLKQRVGADVSRAACLDDGKHGADPVERRTPPGRHVFAGHALGLHASRRKFAVDARTRFLKPSGHNHAYGDIRLFREFVD